MVMVLCCCNERQIASLLRLGGERGGDCLQRRPHLHCITSSQLQSCGGFNCFTAAATTTLLGEEQSQGTHLNRHILHVYVKIPHAKLLSPFLDHDFRTVLQRLGMRGNRVVHIAFHRSATSSLANTFHHLPASAQTIL